MSNLLLSDLRQSFGLLRRALYHRLDLLIPTDQVPNVFGRLLLSGLQKILPKPSLSNGERLRAALIEQGPVFIKLGQLLSTRRDLFPDHIVDALALLQDQVPPSTTFKVHDYVDQQLGRPWTEVFAKIDTTPMASASIAQVYGAQLRMDTTASPATENSSRQDVVIKIVRPDIEEKIIADMRLLKSISARITQVISGAERLHLPQVMADHEQVLLQELDMQIEGANQQQLRRNFAESNNLYVPRLYDQFTSKKMLVMERVYGIPIGNIDELKAANVDLKVLAYKGVETFFTQVFEHNFFHADMHPGNILIDVSNPADPKYIALDCAIIGTLTGADQNYLAQNLVAFFQRDYAQVVALHLQSGWVPADTNADEFETVIREVCDPIFAKPLAEISFGEFVLTLFQTAGQFEMEIQPQLVLLQKTLLYIEGLGRQLYPQLDLWETAQPFMEAWVADRFGPAALLTNWIEAGPEMWTKIAALPDTIKQNDATTRDLRRQLSVQSRELAKIHASLRLQQRRRRQLLWLALAGIVIVLWLN